MGLTHDVYRHRTNLLSYRRTTETRRYQAAGFLALFLASQTYRLFLESNRRAASATASAVIPSSRYKTW